MNVRDESYLEYLPPVLWEEKGDPPEFLRRFLHIFEDLFEGLEKEVDDIPKLFDPWKTPSTFLSWLASWVALELDKDWSELKSRTLIRHIVSLYRKRGTLRGLEKYLRIYVGTNVHIEELPVNTSPHIFKVIIVYPSYEPSGRVRRAFEVRTVLDREKPAHTHYNLIIENPTMQIGVHSTIGVDTILGTL